MTIEQAIAACREVGADLPKMYKADDKANLSWSQCESDGRVFQSPLYLRQENFSRYSSSNCDAVEVACTAADISKMEESNPRGNVRLISEDGTMKEKAGHIDDENNSPDDNPFIDVSNFKVSNSQGLELVQWHTGKTGAANEG